ncbi:MAG: hypothetical protein HY481_01860 [Candidatus Vogelbacteria bacterium]|nr:hypothetical protein [Candidatus Vogelbacteria bacterium]
MNEKRLLPTSIVLAALIIGFVWLYTAAPETIRPPTEEQREENAAPAEPEEPTAQTVEIPAVWGDLGTKMVAAGVIDRAKFEALYAGRSGLTTEEMALIDGVGNGPLKVTEKNANLLLNLFWALGLSNKNEILETGPMMDSRYGGGGPPAGGFASTGGWTLAKGKAMDHYSQHSFFILTSEQQALVERVSQNIYRPCCDNSTYFPDCNHGMAMLGLLELLASQGASENQMYTAALEMNSFWFPEQYAVIARYLASQGKTLAAVNPKEILGNEYSSGSGFQRIAALVPQTDRQSGGSCGV